MKLAIIGTTGQLGHDMQRYAARIGHEVLAIAGRADLDICSEADVNAMLDRLQPQALVNTAAFHNVDLCETQTEAAYKTNVLAVRHLAQACETRKILFVQVGTDYVFEGTPARKPLPEEAPVCPKSIYALSRFGGDCMTQAFAPQYGYVVRSCGLFGVAGCKLKGGLNFVDMIISMAKAKKPMRVVNDQTVAPTPTDDLARQIINILEKRMPTGIYHAVSHDECTWHQFAVEALRLAGIDHPIEPVPSSTWAAAALRPTYSVLDNARLRSMGMDIMAPWEESLRRYVREKYG
jgi:dTDP-4-dehydrorhamnose reductase